MEKSSEGISIVLTIHIVAGWAAFSTGTRCSIPWGLGGGDLCLVLLSMC